MQEFTKDLRLCVLTDTETNEKVWLRRHILNLHSRKDLHYILDTEQRGSERPMSEQEIETFFLGDGYEHYETLRHNFYHPGDPRMVEEVQGICYYPTCDTQDKFYKDETEAPAVGHILWSASNDEFAIRSVAADAEFHFRSLMFSVLLDELKTFVLLSIGCKYAEKISALLRTDHEHLFYERNHFKTVHMPEGIDMAYWLPEFEGKQKKNRRENS